MKKNTLSRCIHLFARLLPAKIFAGPVVALFVTGFLSTGLPPVLSHDAAAQEAKPVRIGEMNSYNSFPAFTRPYRLGWELGLQEINAAGGVMGRPLVIISRDDGGTTANALRTAQELVKREEVSALAGTFLSNIGLGVADYAKRSEIIFLAAEPLTDALTMEGGNPYTFRIRPNTYMQTAMLVDEAVLSGKTRWAIIAPNYEYGLSAAQNFKHLLSEKMPSADIVVEQYPQLGKLDAGPTIQALIQAKPDGIFNVLFGGDLAVFVREGNQRGLFQDKTVLSLLTGEPEWLDPLGGEAPVGWIVTGYPWYDLDTPAHNSFLKAYQQAYDDYPRLGSVVGYMMVHTLAKAIETAQSTQTQALIEALEGMSIDTPFGPVTFRPQDHQSTMGAFVGTVAVRDGKGVMVNWTYRDGRDYMHTLEEVRSRRP